MLDRLLGFEWDVHNIGHIALHGVSPAEVEETTARLHFLISAKPAGTEKRWKLFGRTAVGRYLVVVFTVRRKQFRTVTEYPMNQFERKFYGPTIEG
jgi:uncharacterized DUF497 family protein